VNGFRHVVTFDVSGSASCPCGWAARSAHGQDTSRLGENHEQYPDGHPDCGCDAVLTDCCDPVRWDCETTVLLDGAGDPDVRACKRGMGCDGEV
jgi:hypothetical protein